MPTPAEQLSAMTSHNRNCLSLRWIATGLIVAVLSILSLPVEAAVIAYWDFQLNPLEDKAGSNDLSNTGVTFGDGAAIFNGSQTVFSTTSTLDLTGATQITLEWFMKTSSTADQIVAEHTINTNSFDGAFTTFNSAAGNVNGFYNRNPGTSSTLSSFINDGQFHHYAMVIDPTVSAGADTRNELFIDYVSVDSLTQADSASFLNDTFFIGSRGNSTLKFIGELDDIRISSVVLAPGAFLQSRTILDPVPEPSTFLLLSLGAMGMVRHTQRRRRGKASATR